MKVILLQDILKLGKKWDIKEVKNGFARNFLLAKKLAKPFTKSAYKELEILKQARERAGYLETEKQNKILEQLKDLQLSIASKANEQGVFFKGIGKQDIRKALIKKEIEIEKDNINLEQPIKKIGQYTITINFSEGRQASFILNAEGH